MRHQAGWAGRAEGAGLMIIRGYEWPQTGDWRTVPEGVSETLTERGALVADEGGVSLILAPSSGRLIGPAIWRPLTSADQPDLLRVLARQRGSAEERERNAGRLAILCAILAVCLITDMIVAYLLAFVAVVAMAWEGLTAASAEPHNANVGFSTPTVFGQSGHSPSRRSPG